MLVTMNIHRPTLPCFKQFTMHMINGLYRRGIKLRRRERYPTLALRLPFSSFSKFCFTNFTRHRCLSHCTFTPCSSKSTASSISMISCVTFISYHIVINFNKRCWWLWASLPQNSCDSGYSRHGDAFSSQNILHVHQHVRINYYAHQKKKKTISNLLLTKVVETSCLLTIRGC